MTPVMEDFAHWMKWERAAIAIGTTVDKLKDKAKHWPGPPVLHTESKNPFDRMSEQDKREANVLHGLGLIKVTGDHFEVVE